jgi:protein CpxP
MDYIQKNKFLTVVVAILVLLNVGVVAFVFFFFKPPLFPPSANARGARFRLIEEQLNLSDAQKTRFKELRLQEFGKMDSLAQRRFQAMRDLFGLLKAGNVSAEQIQQKASVIGEIETEQSASMFHHFRMLRAICTPEQQKEFDKIVVDAMMQARGTRGGMEPKGPGFREPGPGGPGFPQGGPPPGDPPSGGPPDGGQP